VAPAIAPQMKRASNKGAPNRDPVLCNNGDLFPCQECVSFCQKYALS